MNPLLIAMLASAGLGLLKGSGNAEKNRQSADYRRAALKYAPWTGMSDPGQSQLPGALESALQGGITGLQVGKFAGLGKASAPAAAGVSTDGSVGTGVQGSIASQGSPLGGQQMSDQLGQFGQQEQNSIGQRGLLDESQNPYVATRFGPWSAMQKQQGY